MTQIDGKRKMSLNDNTSPNPEAKQIQVEKWLKEDLQKVISTLWLIVEDQEIVSAIANKFLEKMDHPAKDQIAQAIKEQVNETKQN